MSKGKNCFHLLTVLNFLVFLDLNSYILMYDLPGKRKVYMLKLTKSHGTKKETAFVGSLEKKSLWGRFELLHHFDGSWLGYCNTGSASIDWLKTHFTLLSFSFVSSLISFYYFTVKCVESGCDKVFQVICNRFSINAKCNI